MDPVYSRDECVAVIRDYYDFLSNMFMPPSFIIEPPQGGWPNITQETCPGLEKTDRVVDLLRHLPYIACRPYSNHPQGLPSSSFIDWTNYIEKLATGDAHPDNELLMSEGTEDQFDGKIPSYCIGLVHGGYLLGEDPPVVLLDTKVGVVHWMNCPDKVKESASPQPSYLVYPLESESQGASEAEGYESGDDEAEGYESGDDEDEGYLSGDVEHEDDHEYEDDEDDDEIKRGPCWPVRHFFEMLKNQFRQLNFIPKDKHEVVDIWTSMTSQDEPIPEGFKELLQSTYRKHGWPEITNYCKDDCLAELKREMDDKFPGHHRYYFR
jgi:hypothetical protein